MDVIPALVPGALPDNVTLVAPLDPVDSYELVHGADLVLAYASSIGMEAAAMGKPVIVAANSNYSAAPFVIRPESRDAYVELLRRRDPPLPPPDQPLD